MMCIVWTPRTHPGLGDIPQDAWPVLLKPVEVMKDKSKLNCHKPEENKETQKIKCNWNRKKTLMERQVKSKYSLELS